MYIIYNTSTDEIVKLCAGYFKFVKYFPYLIQTIGRSELYKWHNMKPESLAKDTRPPFKDIFSFEDDNE